MSKKQLTGYSPLVRKWFGLRGSCGGFVLISSKLQRRLSSTLSGAEPETPNESADATSFDESLKALAGVGARRDLLGSLGVAGIALLTALGLGGEATAEDAKNNDSGKKNGDGSGKKDGNGPSHRVATRVHGRMRS